MFSQCEMHVVFIELKTNEQIIGFMKRLRWMQELVSNSLVSVKVESATANTSKATGIKGAFE